MTTEELVAIFVGVVTALTTVVSGIVRSSRAARLRRQLEEDLRIYQRLPSGSGARPLLREGIDRNSADLVALTLVPMRSSVFIYAFLAFVFWGVVIIVYVLEGPGPLLFAAGVGRGLVNWLYIVGGLVALTLLVRSFRVMTRQRERVRNLAL
ncbi:MAG TPA: hypothetical protein VEX88_08115 [Glaciibacter sp.]|nr:hypothetical protein [Glaciibacter sp.]